MFVERVTIVVDDYDEAIPFFVDLLGFELVEDAPAVASDGSAKRWVVVRPPGAETSILLAQAASPEQAMAVGRQTGGRVGFFLRVDDVDATYERLLTAGVRFTRPPRNEAYGRVAVFLDVAGNAWDLLGPGVGSSTHRLESIGRVESPLGDGDEAPRQPDEGAPPATLVLDPLVEPALDGLQVGDEIVVLTWLDRAPRDELVTRPRGDAHRPVQGVFSTRSPGRPNPIGLHRTTIASIAGTRVGVDHLEALDGTPVLDIKPALGPPATR